MPTAHAPADAPHAHDASKPKFGRVLLKLSGEAFSSSGEMGVEPSELELIAREVVAAAETGAQVAVVVGGGNIIRGATLAQAGQIPRATADHMGMLGTVINGLALKEMLATLGQPARCMTAIEINAVAEPFIRGRAIRHLEKGNVVVLAGGTGNPFFTTDTCAALRATELDCDVVLKATKVDGVYTADPKKDPSATRYERLSFDEALSKGLKIMDATALAMCKEQKLPVLVFDFKKSGNIRAVVEGKSIGTLIHA
jgi:uridylate kinase